MINCLIVDDEQHAIDVLVHHVNRTDFLHLIGTTTDATQALNMINSNKVDLLFQDIHMPELSGIDMVKILQGKCEIILTTAYSNYAVEGFELGVADYLLKPIAYPRFMKAVQKVVDKTKLLLPQPSQDDELKDNFIYVKTGLKNSVIKVILNTVEYIESEKNYVAIYHDGQKTLAYTSLKEIEACLPLKHFIRVHRSFIVPLSRIERVEGNTILLQKGKIGIPLSDSYKAVFWEMVNDKTVG
jgi:two-component system, LytTR family, response regulator